MRGVSRDTDLEYGGIKISHGIMDNIIHGIKDNLIHGIK